MYIQTTIYYVCFPIDWQKKKDIKFTMKQLFHCPQSHVNGKHLHVAVFS